MKHATRQLAQYRREKAPAGCARGHGYVGGICIYCGKARRKKKR